MQIRTFVDSARRNAADLSNRAKDNWSTRKAEIIASGSASTLLAGGVATSAAFGPVGLAIGVAGALLIALGLFLRSVFKSNEKKEEPKLVEVEMPVIAKKEIGKDKSEPLKAVAEETKPVEKKAPSFIERVKAHPIKSVAVGTAAFLATGGIAYGIYSGCHTDVINSVLAMKDPILNGLSVAGTFLKDNGEYALNVAQEKAAAAVKYVSETAQSLYSYAD